MIILVANKTVGTECPVGNNVDPDSADVGEAMCKQKTFSCLKSTKYSRVPIRRHGTFIRHTPFIRPNTFSEK